MQEKHGPGVAVMRPSELFIQLGRLQVSALGLSGCIAVKLADDY